MVVAGAAGVAAVVVVVTIGVVVDDTFLVKISAAVCWASSGPSAKETRESDRLCGGYDACSTTSCAADIRSNIMLLLFLVHMSSMDGSM